MTQQTLFWKYFQTQNTNLKECKHSYVHCSVIYNGQNMEAAQVSISRWVDKIIWDSYTVEYYSGVKKKILPFETEWMDLENIMLSEIGQSE